MNNIVQKKISIDGVKVNYYLAGTGNEQVLLLHGWGSSFENWRNFLSLVDGQKFTWIFLELPGFASSDTVPKPWSVSDYLVFCQEFLKHENLKPQFLMAHSFGARISIKWLNQENNFKKVVFTGAAGIKNPLSISKKIIQNFSPFLNKIKIPSKVKALFYRLIGSPDYYSLSEVMKETFKNVIAEDLTSMLQNIKQPVQLIWGKKDTYTPMWMGELMNAKIPNSSLYIFSDGRHGLHHTNTKELCDLAQNFFNS